MREKTHFRNCPTCSKTLGHTTVYSRDASLNKQCRSCSQKGKTHSAEHRAKIRAAHTGKTHSAEHKAKVSAAKKGKKNYKLVAYNKTVRDLTTKMYGQKTKRNQTALRKWGKQIQERDDYQCQCCGAEKTTPRSMHAHHIVPCEYFPETALDLSNGITLCNGCHKSLHLNLDRLTMAGTKLDAEGFREHYNSYMSNHSFLRPFIPSSVLDIELRSISYLIQQTA